MRSIFSFSCSASRSSVKKPILCRVRAYWAPGLPSPAISHSTPEGRFPNSMVMLLIQKWEIPSGDAAGAGKLPSPPCGDFLREPVRSRRARSAEQLGDGDLLIGALDCLRKHGG